MKNLSNDDYRELMAALSLILGFIYIFSITFGNVPEKNQRFADIVLGMIASVIFGRVFEYYFGKGNKKEDEIKEDKGLPLE